MSEGTKAAATLSRTIAMRIILFAALAMLIQAVVIITHYYSDNARLAALMIERESGAIAEGVVLKDGHLAYLLPPSLNRYTESDSGYFTRIRTPEGEVIYSDCDSSCGSRLLPQQISPPDFWSRLLRPGKPLAVAGGRSLDIAGHKVFVEVAVIDDHESVMRRVLARELADDLATPMCLMLVFALGGMLLSVRLALRPVETSRGRGRVDRSARPEPHDQHRRHARARSPTSRLPSTACSPGSAASCGRSVSSPPRSRTRSARPSP